MNTKNYQNRIAALQLLLIVLVMPALIFCQEINLSDSIPFNSVVKKSTLSNGFTYYLSRNTNQSEKIFIKLNIKAGIYQQDADQTEVAHILEHIVFRSSAHYPVNKSFKEYLKEAGITNYNAHPNIEFITFYFEIPADTVIIEKICLAFQDWLSGQSTLSDKILEAEKKIVAAESTERGQVGYLNTVCELLGPSRFSQNYAAAAFSDFTNKIIALHPAAIRKFYHDWYRPELAGLFITGDFDIAAGERIVKRMFGNLRNPVEARPYINYPISLTGKNKFITDIRRDTEAQNFSLELFYLQNCATETTYRDYKDAVKIELLDNMIKQRLADQYPFMQEPVRGSAGNGIYSIFNIPVRSLNFSVRCEQSISIDSCFKMLFLESERIKRYGFGAEELERSRSERLMNTAINTESLIEETNRYSNHFIYGQAAPGAVLLRQLRQRFISEITLSEINALARSWISDINRNIVIRFPGGSKINLPTESSVLSLLKNIQKDSLVQYSINKGVVSGQHINFDSIYHLNAPAPYTRRNFPGANITQLEFAAGPKIIIKPAVSASGNRVYIKGIRPIGASGYADTNYFSARMAAQLVPKAGLGEITNEYLETYKKKNSIGSSAEISNYETTVKGSAADTTSEILMQLIYRYFLAPRKDSVAFIREINTLTKYASNDNYINKELTTITGHAFESRDIANGLSTEEVSKINYDQALRSYKDFFSAPEKFTFVITGVRDLEKTIALSAKYLGNLSSSNKNTMQSRIIDSSKSGFSVHKTVLNKNLKKDRAGVFVLYGGYHIYSSRERIKQYVLGKVIEAACTNRLREKESGIYSLSAGMHSEKIPGHNSYWYQLKISFVCGPAISAKLIQATEEEIEIIKKNGPQLNDFNAAIQAYKKDRLLANNDDAMWQSQLLELLRNNEDYSVLHSLDSFVDTLRPDDIQQAALEYLNKDHFISYTEIPLNK